MTNPAPRTPRTAVVRLVAVVMLLVLALPMPSISSPPSAQAASTCEGWQGHTTRRIQFTSDGVLHLVGCNETFTLTDIANAAASNNIVGTEPADLIELVDTANKTWLLNYDLNVEEGATLNLIGGAGGDVNWLRLKSGPSAGIISILARNSTLLIQNTRVSSWDPAANAPDVTTPGAPGTGGTKPRSFIRARSEYRSDRAGTPGNVCDTDGGRDYYEARMDIIGSQVDHLGYYGAEAYGLSWKVYTTEVALIDSRELYNRADVFGTIQNSTINENYFGGYTFGGFCMDVSGNSFHDNYYYGFDPHDDTDYLTVTNNSFNTNGGHGFICSKFCDHTVVQNNTANGNHGNGFMLHDRTDGALVEGNTGNNNGDSGLAIFDSYDATVRNNHFEGNDSAAIRLSVGASDNLIENNVLTGGTGSGTNNYVLYSYAGSDATEGGGPNTVRDNIIRGNTITGTGSPVVKMSEASGNLIEDNTITAAPTLTTYSFRNGQGNIIRSNTVSGPTSVETYRSNASFPSPTTIFEDPQIGQEIAVENDTGSGATTTVRDSQGHIASRLTMTASPNGSEGTLTTSSTTITPQDFTVVPASNSVIVRITKWTTQAPFDKSWTETADISPGAVDHTVGNLQANTCYEVKAGTNVVGRFLATGTGSAARISFEYLGAYPSGSALTFIVSETTAECEGQVPVPTLTLSKEKSKFNGWVIATLSGFAPNSTVTVTWPDNTVMATGETDATGAGTAKFRTPLVPLGNYTVTATDLVGASATDVLRVIPRVMVQPESFGSVGSNFRIYFYGFSPGNEVEIKWYNSSGTNFDVLKTVTIADNGRASTLVTVPNGTTLGDHLIRGDVVGISRSATTTFTVTPPPVISLSKEKSKFNGWVEVTLSGFTPENEITVRWPDGTVMATATADGDGNATTGFRTPLVPLGNYTVEAIDPRNARATTTLRVIPRILLSEFSGPAGLRIGAHLYGFSPGNRVEIRFYSTADGSGSYEVLATITIADNGRGHEAIFVPDDAAPGDHLIRADVVGISRSVSTTFTVTGPSASDIQTPTPTPSPSATATPAPDGSPSPEPVIETPTPAPTEPVVATETPVPTSTGTPEASPVAFSEDFESGSLDDWQSTGITVDPAAAYTGRFGAQAAASEGVMAVARRTLGSPQPELYYRIRFRLDSAETAAYLLRVRTAENDGILGVALSDDGHLGIFNQVTGDTMVSEVSVSTGVWHELLLHVDQANGIVEVWFDTQPVPALSVGQALGAAPIGVVELGDASTQRAFVLAFDDVVVDTTLIPSTFPPPVEATPTPEPSATAEATATSEPIVDPTETLEPEPTQAPSETPAPTETPVDEPAPDT